MSKSDSTPDGRITYRLALLLQDSKTVLSCPAGAYPCLPRLSIAAWARPARQIQNAVRARWNVSVIVLDFLLDNCESPLSIAEYFSGHLPEGLMCSPVDQLEGSELSDRERRALMEAGSGNPGARGPFSRVGWIREALDWIGRVTGDRSPNALEIDQQNASGTFALARFSWQSGKSYWLKAAGPPNLHERAITWTLARICPEYLPRVIASRSDWNAWLMEDAGEPGGREAKIESLLAAASGMADLQRKTAPNVESLLSCGAADHRMSVLASQIGEIIAYLERAMRLQTSRKAPPIGPMRLNTIGEILQRACAAMAELGIPDAVIHNDLNWGNILYCGTRCSFVDWSEAAISCPVLTLHSFHLLAQNQSKQPAETMRRLSDTYGSRWAGLVSPERMKRAVKLAPLLAIASQLYGRGEWLASDGRDYPDVQRYARTLARHMDRAISDPQLKGGL